MISVPQKLAYDQGSPQGHGCWVESVVAWNTGSVESIDFKVRVQVGRRIVRSKEIAEETADRDQDCGQGCDSQGRFMEDEKCHALQPLEANRFRMEASRIKGTSRVEVKKLDTQKELELGLPWGRELGFPLPN